MSKAMVDIQEKLKQANEHKRAAQTVDHSRSGAVPTDLKRIVEREKDELKRREKAWQEFRRGRA